MTRVIAIVNRKGGSGKTVTVFNLAGAFAEAGKTVLAIDLDPQGSLSKGLKVPATNLPLSQALIKGDEGFDSLIQPTAIENLFVIPADRDLNAIARERPATVDQLAGVTSFGQITAERLAPQILELVRSSPSADAVDSVRQSARSTMTGA